MSIEFAKPLKNSNNPSVAIVGRYVEIYQGLDARYQNYSDTQTIYRSVLRGVVKSIEGECIELECTNFHTGEKVTALINTWSIYSIFIPKNSESCMYGCYQADGDRRPIIKEKIKEPTED